MVASVEAWFYFSNQHEQLWLPEHEDFPTNARQLISSPKTMPTVVWNLHGFHMVKVLPRACKSTNQYHIDHILPEICSLRFAGDRTKSAVRADRARRHDSTRVKQSMEDQSLRTASTMFPGSSTE
jgi:hypothetical protein